MVAREDRRQARRGGALERAELQRAVRRVALERGLRLAGELQQPLGVAEQHLAFGGEHQPAALAVEEARAQALLELLDARRDVGLHAVAALLAARRMPPCSATALKILSSTSSMFTNRE